MSHESISLRPWVECEAKGLFSVREPKRLAVSIGGIYHDMVMRALSGTQLDQFSLVPDVNIRFDAATPSLKAARYQSEQAAQEIMELLHKTDWHISHVEPPSGLRLEGASRLALAEVRTGLTPIAAWLDLGKRASGQVPVPGTCFVLHAPRKKQNELVRIRSRSPQALITEWGRWKRRIGALQDGLLAPTKSPGHHCASCLVPDCPSRWEQ